MEKLKISYYLPEQVLTNERLAEEFKDWNSKKILRKTGIATRHIAGEETACDMAVKACERLFKEYEDILREEIDFVLLVTQSPDYRLPGCACMLQERLGLSKTAGAYDINLGCSGYVYGLATAKGLIAAGIAKHVLLVTSETYSKWIHKMDKSVRTLFGDGAAAAYLNEENVRGIREFVFGTDGSGFDQLIIPAGGSKIRSGPATSIEETDEDGYVRTQENLYMNGGSIFNFTMETVPALIRETLAKNGRSIEEIDLFILHQANRFMLQHIREMMEIDEERFYINMEDTGNTVSSTIPIAMKRAQEEGKLREGMKIVLAGFGVGLSWGAVLLEL